MKRRHIIRLQVAVLLLLTVLVLARTFSGEGPPDGIVVFSGIEAYTLEQSAFRVADPVQVRVSATGSVESRSEGGDTTLAAYGWLLDHETREPVWVMHRRNTRPGKGTLVHQDTTITLEAGAYEAYFASYGNNVHSSGSRSFFSRLFDERQHWINDAREWSFVVTSINDAQGSVAKTPREDLMSGRTPALWESGPVRNRQTAEKLFEVRAPVSVHLYATGEISSEPDDHAWVRRVAESRTVWTLTEENTRWAGGADVNRAFRGEVALEPGVYAFGFSADPGHAFGDWRANPPFDPYGWGLSVDLVSPADSAHVSPFDPWVTLRPAVSLTQVGNDQRRAARIDVDRATPIVIYALGELGRSRYDYGTLAVEDGDSTVWGMSVERSTPAGGHENNRREIAFLTLEPGSYQLEYRTDGSHAFGDWRNGKPDHPDRWGVTVFTSREDTLAVSEVEEETPEVDAVENVVPAAPAPPAPPEGPELVQLTRIGNDSRESRPFTVESAAEDIYVRAVGELTLSNRYDYAWIENAETGQTVWEMTFDNTSHAGGHNRNRIFEGVIKLPPGRYVAHYHSDFSHAFGDFRSEAEQPSEPEAWGIVIRPQP